MDDRPGLAAGDKVPHFRLSATDGRVVDYAAIWQSKNLVLVALPPQADAGRTVAELRTLNADDTTSLVTREAVPGLPPPGVLIADKWGEIMYVATASDVNDLPGRDELAAWIEHVRQRCPECEGEAR